MRVRRTVENTLKGSGTEKRGGETRILKKRGRRWWGGGQAAGLVWGRRRGMCEVGRTV